MIGNRTGSRSRGMSSPETREARPEDIDGVVEIATATALRSGSSAAQSRTGYLVSGYDRAEYEGFVEAGATLLVAIVEGRVAGFLLGYPAAAASDEAVLKVCQQVHDGPAYVVKQVAVAPWARGGGVGTALYEEFERRTEPLPLFAAVKVHPPNVASMRFHDKRHYRQVASFVAGDGEGRVLLARGRTTTGDSDPDAALLQQYEAAVDLYQHEDHLNWTKLNNFFYVTAGLLAVLGLGLEDVGDLIEDGASRAFAAGVAALGLVISVVFTLALRSGIHYLHARKRAAKAIDDRLASTGGTEVIQPRWAASDPLLTRSTTTRMLRAVPMFAAVAWLAILVWLTT